MKFPLSQIRAAAAACRPAMVDFTQRMVQTPSPSGKESDIAALITAEMETLGYDDIWPDEAGNLIGVIHGGDGPPVMLNGHMDHVDPGPIDGWPYSPFSGEIVGDELWGRGSVDMKGPVAAMIYAAGLFKKIDVTPPGDVLMTVPVMEEMGGMGTQFLTTHLRAAAAICGEPSHNTLRRGHRGRVELIVTFKGRSAHASVPHLGLNPHYGVAAFLMQLPYLAMPNDEALGSSSVTPTLYATDQVSPNVIPSEVKLVLDWRNIPQESPQAIIGKVKALAEATIANSEAAHGVEVVVEVASTELVTYTGLEKDFPAVFPSFLLPADSPYIQSAYSALTKALPNGEGVDVWRFATDGGHLMAADIPTVGFGPGDERLAHTNQERVSLNQMEDAVIAYTTMTLALGETALELE